MVTPVSVAHVARLSGTGRPAETLRRAASHNALRSQLGELRTVAQKRGEEKGGKEGLRVKRRLGDPLGLHHLNCVHRVGV